MKCLKPLLLVMVLALLASCAGFKPGISDDDTMTIIENLNSGQAEVLIDSSALPFIFDSEILASESQLRLLWTGLIKAGYLLDAPVIQQQRPVQAGDAALFSESWEIKTYFKNILSEEDVFVEINASGRKVYMILRSEKKGRVSIMAWKGVKA
ncbi:hypothetical protein [Oceanispirochaeta sp.]|jgi:hypothetical protein|uniref:hypothetical protein n=1 Tax=Oceanispirochaeta sp. TaxID=2035350 RepID=UPI00262D0F1F|nr:hypothetical protein [Oceanispirochaeta sp.]MDA3958817.1 hypothetical protein [Oceanispirochaeta sp.]